MSHSLQDVTAEAEHLALLVRHSAKQRVSADGHKTRAAVVRALDPLSCVHDAIDNPTRFACRAKAREIGWQLYVEGGFELMTAALDAAQEREAGAGWVLDAWWDGIGAGSEIWVR
jgi:hypothetical protein